MSYLNLDLDYFDHPKTKRLIGLLGRGAEVLPIRLWIYCGKFHSEQGRLSGYSPQEIESVAGWWGKSGDLVPALIRAGFITQESDGDCQMVAWEEHQGHIAALKRKGKAMAEARWSRVRVDADSITGSNAIGPPKQCPNKGRLVGTEGTDQSLGLKRRLGSLFRRKETTPFSEKEEKSLAKLEIASEELELIEAYYTASIAKDDYRRRDLFTLLNNWTGEVDRARRWLAGPQGGKGEQSEIKENIKVKVL